MTNHTMARSGVGGHKIRWTRLCVAFSIAVTILLPPSATSASSGASPRSAMQPQKAQPTRNYAGLPLSFEMNGGQANPSVAFITHSGGYTAFLSPSQATFGLTTTPVLSAGLRQIRGNLRARDGVPLRAAAATVRLHLAGANPHACFVGLNRLPGVVNSFIGRDPSGWHTHIPTYARIEARGIYPGIDLIYYGHGQQLEYDWVLHPGARLSAIRFSVTGTGHLLFSRERGIVVSTAAGTLVQGQPRAYSSTSHGKRAVHVRFTRIGGSSFGLDAGRYDTSRTLIVDPIVGYASYLGGRFGDVGKSIAIDSQGDMYVAGITASPDFPTQKPFEQTPVGARSTPHVFVSELNPSGNALIFSTYLGGAGFDESFGIAEDATGIYVAGDTNSSDFPTVHAFQPQLGGATDAFITKFAPGGDALVYSSYLGGPQEDRAYGLAIDGLGDAYITGDSVPLLRGSGANAPPNLPHAFVARIGPAGALLYNRPLVGNFAETASGVAADRDGNAYVVGSTQSTDFPSNQSPPPGRIGPVDGYVIKLDPSGQTVLYSTHLGGNDGTVANAIVLDSAGNAYVAGQTAATNLPVAGGFQLKFGGHANSIFPGDGYVTKLDAFGRIRYGTYLGGAGDDEAVNLAIDPARNVYVTGWTDSADFPIKEAIQPAFTGADCGSSTGSYPCTDAFVTAIKSNGQLGWSTYVGGSGSDYGSSVAVSPDHKVYVAGTTTSHDFPTVRPIRPHMTGPQLIALDAFVLELVPGATQSNHSMVIDKLGVYHRVHAQTQSTNVIHLGEEVSILANYHDTRGVPQRAFGTLSISKNGHEILQGFMQPRRLNNVAQMEAVVPLVQKRDLGPLVARVAVISNGSTAIGSVTFQVVPK